MKKTIATDFDWINYKKEDLEKFGGQIKELIKSYKQEILKIEKKDLSFRNFIHRSEILSADIGKHDGALFAYVNLHTDENIRNTARKIELEISEILNKFVYDEELYLKFLEYFNGNFKIEVKNKNLTGEEIKIVKDSDKGYKKMGMHLSTKDKQKLLKIKNQINKLAQEFDVLNTKNYDKGLWFKKEELLGVPPEYFKSFKFDKLKSLYFINCSGRDDLGIDYPIIKKYCTVAKTREKATKYNEEGVGDANTKKLAKILELRNQIVKMLGFKTWADLAVKEEMMNKPEEIKKFLRDLLTKLTPKFELTKTKLSKILKERDEKLSTSSFKFAEELLKIEDIVVREEEYKPYFELENVLGVLFAIWENYFDIKTKYLQNIKVMHQESKVYEFTDGKSGELLGHGCMDLHPRTGKYGHACVADIYKKFIDLDGNKHAGFTFLICNFKKALDGKTFVSLSDMNTLFHEAGHMLHMILMKNNYPSTSGTSRDFVEIPSQFHENFLANEKFMAENFKHFETGEKMSKLLIQNIKKMTNRGEEITWVAVCIRALFDQSLHSKNILKFAKNFKNIDREFESLWKKYYKVEASKSRHFPSTFAHIVHDYDAKYYSYVISRVYAQDFWGEFSKAGIKKGKMSEKYKKFLEAGNTKEEKELVKEFLERKVSLKPFLEFLK